MKKLDLPPVWLIGFAVLAWVQADQLRLGLGFGGGVVDLFGGLLVGGGIILVGMAALEFRRHRTTIDPRNTPVVLITSGPYKRSRNPIYLGDALILTGLILRFDAVLSLPLVPIFIWVMERRFIFPEETRLRRQFRQEFHRYETKVRRWV
ncbi:isoprenylcysteine carboxylmethyltransferase family protein [Rhodobacteraceae bacterium F11138]|nr:isoprenylcysteine carboxylmethyltransferase family protein [Rhodobacteraceae bacterium F11138]